ncbi:MAG: hypothetical protein LC107_14275 [Chitinophagales bacterium]|nr:hypothetical protein [Chitinophagales bacterium]
MGETKPELKLAGFIKQKNQDVCVSPGGFDPEEEVMTEGILREARDFYGKEFTERTISINIRSQMSSLAKNFDTLYERTIAEAQNLHVRCPKMVLGEVYMIPVKEYDPAVMDEKKIQFLDSIGAAEKYIKSFQAINGRVDYTKEEYKYERVCLLIVDFQQTPAKIYNTSDELKEAGLIPIDSMIDFSELSWNKFVPDLLKIYKERFS